MSPLEVIQAVLMGRQKDGQRHMEAFGYDAEWVASVEKELSREARMVLDYITNDYAAEHGPVNAVFRERNGVDLPSHDNYAPLTVKPMQAKAGEMVDPVSGGVVAAGGGYTPGSLRTRSRIAEAEPEFRDALQTYLAHKRQINHWLAYGDFAADAQAVFGNRDLMNAVQAKGGEEAVTVLRKWVDVFTQGGVRDASADCHSPGRPSASPAGPLRSSLSATWAPG
jgi:hypothetical protein